MILAEDEAHVNLLPWLRSTWIVKGERQEVMTPGKNQKRSIFGAIALATGRWLCHIAERANSATFIEFLGQIVDAYPKAPVIAIVLDNVSTHSSRAVQRWLVTVASNCSTAPATMLGRLEEVHAFFRARARAQMLATSAPFNTPWLPAGYGQRLWKAA